MEIAISSIEIVEHIRVFNAARLALAAGNACIILTLAPRLQSGIARAWATTLPSERHGHYSF
jgi:hypothetical protein